MDTTNEKEIAFANIMQANFAAREALVVMLNGDISYCQRRLEKPNIPEREADTLRGRIEQCKKTIARTSLNERN